MELVLIAIGSVGVLVAVVWLALRLQTQTSRAERTELLKRAQAELGGRLERVGTLGLEALILEEDGLTTKIVLDQRVCPHQNRHLTSIELSGRRASSPRLHARTAGMSPGDVFPRGSALSRIVAINAAGSEIELNVEPGEEGERAARDAGLLQLLEALSRRAGLAKFELMLDGSTRRFALEGFVTDTSALRDLRRLLADVPGAPLA
jgi:hypothetical protein